MYHSIDSDSPCTIHHSVHLATARPLWLKRTLVALLPAMMAAAVALVALFVMLRPVHAVNCIVPTGYATIQDAIDDPLCDTVRVASGLYTENVVIDRDVEIYGAGPGSTVIDGDGLDSVIDIDSDVTAVISRTTIRNGAASQGGGIYNQGHLTLFKTEVRENLATSRGAGIYNGLNGTLILEESVVHLNEADGAGGIVFGAGIYSLGTITATGNSRAIDNFGEGSQSKGGGIYIDSGGSLNALELLVSNNVISGSISEGAGLYNSGELTLENSLITSNFITASIGNGSGVFNAGTFSGTEVVVLNNLMATSIGRGAGFYNNNSGDAQFLGGVFESNTADDDGGAVYNLGSLNTEDTVYENNSALSGGGAIYNSSFVTATDIHLFFNDSDGRGGALYNSESFLGHGLVITSNVADDGGALYNTGGVTLTQSAMLLNEATDDGGAIYNNSNSVVLVDSNIGLNTSDRNGGAIFSRDIVTLTRVTLFGNSAVDYGAGVYLDDGSLWATNVTVAANEGEDTASTGAALYMQKSAQATLVHNTIVSNTVGGANSGGIVADSNTAITTTGTIIGYNSNSNCDVTGSLSSGGYNLENANDCGLDGEGDLVNTAPLLGNLAFHGGHVATHPLLAASPAVDAAADGAPLCPETDARGVSRQVGEACDIGAYEALQLTISDVEVQEDAGQVEVVVSAGAVVPEPTVVTVDFTTGDGTAVAGSDYGPGSGQAVTGTLSIEPGRITETIVVDIIDDNIDELDETFYVTLDSPSNALLGKASGAVVILDDEGPAISIDDVVVEEGDAASSNALFTVSLSASSVQTVTVAYTTGDGTATAGSDYVATNGTVSFAPGDTTATISVEVLGDTVVESDEVFTVSLSDANNGSLSVTQATGTILNEDENKLHLPTLYRP